MSVLVSCPPDVRGSAGAAAATPPQSRPTNPERLVHTGPGLIMKTVDQSSRLTNPSLSLSRLRYHRVPWETAIENKSQRRIEHLVGSRFGVREENRVCSLVPGRTGEKGARDTYCFQEEKSLSDEGEGKERTGTKCDRHEWQFAIGSGHVGRSRRGRGPNISLEVIRSRGNLCSQRG